MSGVVIHGTWQDELPKLADESVDLIIIDPPYLLTNEKWDKMEQVNGELSNQLFRVASEHCSLYVWCSIGEKSQSLIRWFPIFSEIWYFKDMITWAKQRGMGMRRGWLYTREEALWFVKNNKEFVWNRDSQYGTERRKRDGGKDTIRPSQSGKYAKSIYKRITNVWGDISEETFDVTKRIKHFTPKPQKAIERIIAAHTKAGDTILDCFAGSGTTGVVAKQLERNYILIESDKEYVDLINERLNHG